MLKIYKLNTQGYSVFLILGSFYFFVLIIFFRTWTVSSCNLSMANANVLKLHLTTWNSSLKKKFNIFCIICYFPDFTYLMIFSKNIFRSMFSSNMERCRMISVRQVKVEHFSLLFPISRLFFQNIKMYFW